MQECGAPLENEAGNCTAVPPPPGHCCPEKFTCGDSEEVGVADEPVSTPLPVVDETTPVAAISAPSESDVSNDAPAEEQTEAQPVRDATTILPIEQVDTSADADTPVQADQPQETVSPTEIPVADEKIEAGSSATTSPGSGMRQV